LSIKIGAGMQSTAIVPDDKVTRPPNMLVMKSLLLLMIEQIVQQILILSG
jgi:hypothetical protein